MSMKELLTKYLNKQAYVIAEGMRVLVVIKDIKTSYGKDRFLVTPVAGEGEVWREQVSLKIK